MSHTTDGAPDVAAQLRQLAPLADPVRRSLYLYVIAQTHDVGRREAATATGTALATAAFHLDRLAEAGLLETSFRRLSGRSGPGAGRPAKLYRRGARPVGVSVPPRNHELAAELLAQAVDDGGPPQPGLAAAAARAGRRMGDGARRGLGRRAGRERTLAALGDLLASMGYQPYRKGDELRLANCPFAPLAEGHRSLVCGMNLALVQGAVAAMGSDSLRAGPRRSPDECCVVVGSRSARRASSERGQTGPP